MGKPIPPGKAGQQPEASVACRPGDRSHEAYTASSKAVLLSPERSVVGAFAVDAAGAAPTTFQQPGASVLPGSENTA